MRSNYVKRFVTMYMHTLDGKPALLCRGFAKGEEYIAFAGGTTPVMLVPTLPQIRREQGLAERNEANRQDATRYGYVRVDVPLDPTEFKAHG